MAVLTSSFSHQPKALTRQKPLSVHDSKLVGLFKVSPVSIIHPTIHSASLLPRSLAHITANSTTTRCLSLEHPQGHHHPPVSGRKLPNLRSRCIKTLLRPFLLSRPIPGLYVQHMWTDALSRHSVYWLIFPNAQPSLRTNIFRTLGSDRFPVVKML